MRIWKGEVILSTQNMRHLDFNTKQLRALLLFGCGSCLIAGSSFGQGGFFSGVGSMEIGCGYDENIGRIPDGVGMNEASPQADAFTCIEGSWNKRIHKGTNAWTFEVLGQSKSQAFYKEANSHHFDIRSEVEHEMNERVRGSIGMLVAQRKHLEVNWSDREQWESMARADIESDARIYFDVKDNLKSELGVTWTRSMYSEDSPDFGNQSFSIDAAWTLNVFSRKKGLYHFKLIHPQRIQDAGLLSLKMKYTQRNFLDWKVGSVFSTNHIVPFGSKWSDLQNTSMSERVWVDWEMITRYSSSEKNGCNAFLEALLTHRSDESLGDFGQTAWAFGAGLLCHSNVLHVEMSLFQERIHFQERLARFEDGFRALEYRIRSWNLEVEIPTRRGWSYIVESRGRLRNSNHSGETMSNRRSMHFHSVIVGVRWQIGHRRFALNL
jgi:hypothetical protein